MFTGIVREVGRVLGAGRAGGVTSLDVEAPDTTPGLAVGNSVSVNGVCLTVTRTHGPTFQVDLSPETLRATTAAAWRAGTRVHLEPSLRASDSLDGHFVLGHVDGVGIVEVVRASGAVRQMTVTAPDALLALLLPKGSIAIDGVSLTLDAGPFDRSFTVTLIPQTLRETTFGRFSRGDRVNLEADVLAKSARRGAPATGRVETARRQLTLAHILEQGWGR
jgi:riboflavin synthase